MNRSGNPAPVLRRPAFQGNRGPGVSGPIAKGGHPPAGFIYQIFKVIQRPAPGDEPVQQNTPCGLALVGMAEHDVAVRQRRAILGQFLQTEDDRICRGLGPKIPGDDLAARSPVAVNGNGADMAFLDADTDACGHQGGGPIGGQTDPLFIRPLFRPDPEMCHVAAPPLHGGQR